VPLSLGLFKEYLMIRLATLFATLTVTTGLAMAAAYASAQVHEHGQHNAASTTPQEADTGLSFGEVRKIDKDTGKLTIQHGPLANLNMPGMTMSFKVQDPAMLDQVKVGDPIRFRVERVNGTYTVTRLQAAG
jgi:Cu/Ag efflux protein CusF